MAGKLAPKQIAQDGATNNQALVWNNTTSKWEPRAQTIGILAFGASNVASSTTTRYLWPWHEDSQAQTAPIQFRIPFDCTVRRGRIRHNGTAGNGNNIVYTLRKNSVATAVVVTQASTAADGNDLTNTADFTAGDLVDIEVTKAASVGTSPTDITATYEMIAR